MAGLLTNPGDYTNFNSGAGSGNGSGSPIALPANTAIGDIQLIIIRTGRTTTGMTFTVNNWIRFAFTKYSTATSANDGAIYFKQITQADKDAGNVTVLLSASVRRAVTIIRTIGLDIAAMTAIAPITPTESFNASTGTSAICPAYTPSSAPTLLLHLICLNQQNPTSAPSGGLTFSGDVGVFANEGYANGIASLTDILFGWRDASDVSQQSASTANYNGGGTTSRSLMATIALPALVANTRSGLVKIWNGTAWVQKPAKVWNGTAWVIKPVKYWDGNAWQLSK